MIDKSDDSPPIGPEEFHDLVKSRVTKRPTHEHLIKHPSEAPAPLRQFFENIAQNREKLRKENSLKKSLEDFQNLELNMKLLWKESSTSDPATAAQFQTELAKFGIKPRQSLPAPITQILLLPNQEIQQRLGDIKRNNPELDVDETMEQVKRFRHAWEVIIAYGANPHDEPQAAMAHLN